MMCSFYVSCESSPVLKRCDLMSRNSLLKALYNGLAKKKKKKKNGENTPQKIVVKITKICYNFTVNERNWLPRQIIWQEHYIDAS